jgi:hypothetical protein
MRAWSRALAALEAEIAALVRTCEPFARKARLMRSVKGVGPGTVTTLLAYLPELGTLTKGEAARLAGLAPINRDSGQTSGRRRVAPGRRVIRRTLDMAAVSARQPQSRPAGLRRPAHAARQALPRRRHRRHAQTDRDPQRHPAHRRALARRHHRLT